MPAWQMCPILPAGRMRTSKIFQSNLRRTVKSSVGGERRRTGGEVIKPFIEHRMAVIDEAAPDCS
jgi:hypothetical protein